MSLTDKEIVKDTLLAQTRSMGTAADDATNDIFSRHLHVPVTDAGTAGTQIDERVVYTARRRCKVVSVKFSPVPAVTADNSDYKTLTLAKRTAGGTATTVAAGATTTAGLGSITALTPIALPLVAAAVNLAAGDSLTFKAIKTGNGVALASSTALASVDVVIEEF